MAVSALAAAAAAVGNSVLLQVPEQNGNAIKPVFYIVIVSPPGAGKTPAIKTAFQPLYEYDRVQHEHYKIRHKEFLTAYKKYEHKNKRLKSGDDPEEEPEKPPYKQIVVDDVTIEKLAEILEQNPEGTIIVADEIIGWMNRMGQYKGGGGDEEQKILIMWSSGTIKVQRKSNNSVIRIDNYANSIIGGIQTKLLEALSKEDRAVNGFFHRFLFVYPEPIPASEWEVNEIPADVLDNYNQLFEIQLNKRASNPKTVYHLSPEANARFKEWRFGKIKKQDRSEDDDERGIISKYLDYCLRFALLLQVLMDGQYRKCEVGLEAMENAIMIMEYFFANMLKALKILTPETPVDKLSEKNKNFYQALPDSFSMHDAERIADKKGIAKDTSRSFINKNLNKLFTRQKRGQYEKMY